MRPFLAIAVWVVILGGLFVYSRTRHFIEPPHEEKQEIQPLPGAFSLELTPTYDVPDHDDFRVTPAQPSPIVVLLNGREIIRHPQTARAGVPLTFTWDIKTSPIHTGKNEFFVIGLPADESYPGAPGMRIRLLRDGAEVGAETIWGEQGHKAEGAVSLVFPKYMETPDSHEH